MSGITIGDKHYTHTEWRRKSCDERFDACCLENKETGCIEWIARRVPWGYGLVCVKGKDTRAHRYSWERTYGPIPDGLHVLHRCDNPPCVNPEHLFIGTNQDNVADKVAKGRCPKGSKSSLSKITEEIALKIFNSTESQEKLGKRYGLAQGPVWLIKHGKTWRHIHNGEIPAPVVSKDRKFTEPRNNISGQRVGLWFVEEFLRYNARREDVYLCKCLCGTSREVIGFSLRHGKSLSCGCISKMSGADRKALLAQLREAA
jgi:hypothetical protein